MDILPPTPKDYPQPRSYACFRAQNGQEAKEGDGVEGTTEPIARWYPLKRDDAVEIQTVTIYRAKEVRQHRVMSEYISTQYNTRSYRIIGRTLPHIHR